MDMDFDLYMNGVVKQARNEVESAGYEQLTTAEDIDKVLKRDSTTLVMTNSIYGYASGIAGPTASRALYYDVLPDRPVIVLAERDKEATQGAHEYPEGYAPSSPSFALVKDGKITEVIEKHQIGGHDVMNVINQLQTPFNKYCEKR